jgi:hypothetical protein
MPQADSRETLWGCNPPLLQTHSLNVVSTGIDLIQFGGKLFNVYAPGFAFLSFPFSVLGFVPYGILNGYVGSAVLMDKLFLALCASISGFVVFKTCQIFTRFAPASLLASFALTLGTSVWPYAESVFSHDASLLSLRLACILSSSTQTLAPNVATFLQSQA